ncbi:MAG TPA: alpha/beta fold hydrolase [Bacteroidetes bacterium]|nr:alpha/beta fold hydrolase [Bacteroidota bacterium]
MPVLQTNDYAPGFPFKSGHLNTIFPALFRQPQKLAYQRERIATPDDDFLDIDFLRNGSRKVAFLLHGLEGSSSSQYVLGMADLFFENGWDVAAINHRSCSGEMNRRRRIYHSGVTDDLHTVIGFLKKNYGEITMVGFSLGGNMTLKYVGEQGGKIDPAIRCAVAVSVPVHLSSCAQKLIQPSNLVYDRRFLRSLRKKVYEKHRQFPETYRPGDLKKVKNLRDFDNYFTAPIHGFADAEDYYAKCSSLPLLKNIQLPTLLINALDDPLLGKPCFPFELAEKSKHFYFLAPRYGGHCGFTMLGKRNYWAERKVLEFVETEKRVERV